MMKIFCTDEEEYDITYAINKVLDNAWAPGYVTKPLQELKEAISFHEYEEEPTAPEIELQPGDICILECVGVLKGIYLRKDYYTCGYYDFIYNEPGYGAKVKSVSKDYLEKIRVIGHTDAIDDIFNIIS